MLSCKSAPSLWCRQVYFARFYSSSTTNGLKLTTKGRILRASGFSPSTHRIFSWWTSVDVFVLSRALHGCNALIDQAPLSDIAVLDGSEQVMQPDNLANTINRCTTLSNAKCSLFIARIQL